jgi:hypothetical protein
MLDIALRFVIVIHTFLCFAWLLIIAGLVAYFNREKIMRHKKWLVMALLLLATIFFLAGCDEPLTRAMINVNV